MPVAVLWGACGSGPKNGAGAMRNVTSVGSSSNPCRVLCGGVHGVVCLEVHGVVYLKVHAVCVVYSYYW